MWLKSGEVLRNDAHTTISNVTQLSSYAHESTLGLNPLSRASDSGTYTCNVIISPDTSSLSVQGANQADMETVIVQGKYNSLIN